MEYETPQILRDFPSELTGERVLLRPPRPGDGPAIWEATDESRERLAPWMPWVKETRAPDDSERFARQAAANWVTRSDLPMTIWERSTNRFLGGTGFHRNHWDVPSFEIGYWIRSTAEGQGFVTETVRVLCCFAFETLAANRVEIRCDALNARSAAVPRRLGFVHEATLRNDSRSVSGELRDTYVFAMIPADYERVFKSR
jgi:ribosomal-protein-serine acetyltransferase